MQAPPLKLNGYQFEQLFDPMVLKEMDQAFLVFLEKKDSTLSADFLNYRENKQTLTALQQSTLLIASAKYLELFIADLFCMNDDLLTQKAKDLSCQSIFVFKEKIVLKAKRLVARHVDTPSFLLLDERLRQQLGGVEITEKKLADYAVPLLKDPEGHQHEIETLTQWAMAAMSSIEGQAVVKQWVSFSQPARIDYQRLIPIIPVPDDALHRSALPEKTFRLRDGFALTDPRMTSEQVLAEIDYCLYCHEHDGDFCSKGFPCKKGDPTKGFRTNPLGNILTGCPLGEKISEMNVLKRDGYGLAALAVMMIDNPMCPATGHRICNDCMKSCIYQKQQPVDVPQIETRILTDVLSLAWGVEIYDLLTRWNPLRNEQTTIKPYNGLKVFIAGMGPAGFTLAHHLLMEGFAVVGSDGLKIEPLPEVLKNQPIYCFDEIKESLSDRVVSGFGGVAEYGITVRWDKNFLKLIYITLMRRRHFQVFGGVRFGGTVTIASLFKRGFDHVSIAVGAGLPRALPVPGSLAPGMRQANDFLMALQLTGAARENSLANLQLRLPAIVIGGGLTGVDAATEAQAYYIKQVEKALFRYEKLCEHQSEARVKAQFSAKDLMVLEEFLAHGRLVKKEREQATKEKRLPDFIRLIQSWGGVTIVYRKTMQESPAYVLNHEELYKALEEGVYYLESMQPALALLDEVGHVRAMGFKKQVKNEGGEWVETDERIDVPAKSILVATGASPNVAYDFEHPHELKRHKMQYLAYEQTEKGLTHVPTARHVKEEKFGAFTSFDRKDERVSFVGDVHPLFHGSVVNAVTSAKRVYPKVLDLFSSNETPRKNGDDYADFSKRMQQDFQATVVEIVRRSDNIIELDICAPIAAERFQPGEFFRLQNYETRAQQAAGTLLQTEPLALLACGVNKKAGTLKFMVIERGVSRRLLSTLKKGDAVALMGPTGIRSKIPDDRQNILIIGNQLGLAYVRAVADRLREKNNRVMFLGYFNHPDECFCREEIERCTDEVLWCFDKRDDPMQALYHYAQEEEAAFPIDCLDRITVMGDACFLKRFQQARQGLLADYLPPDVKVYGAIHGSMQCMLKGVCAQCLQWQIDPESGERTKAVFACSWQDQPLELVDLDHYSERSKQNNMAETLANLWLDYLFETQNISRI
jgi:NADPH-dependent glutamate synthase beta subunit-like oxidoreductase/NAD(P)H-flavin reductase